MSDLHARLRHQSLGRPFTAEETALAQALEKVFRAGRKDFEDVARALERDGIKRPSGAAGRGPRRCWSRNLSRINASLDAAYAENGIGA